MGAGQNQISAVIAVRLLLALALCFPLAAQHRLWRVSAATYGGAQVADTASSWGRYEGNQLLRSAGGRFGARGVVIKAGISGGVLLAEWFVLRRHPRAARSLAFVNFASAGVVAGAAFYNSRR
jgi:hypothetical protein